MPPQKAQKSEPFGSSGDHSPTGLRLYPSQIGTDLLQIVVKTTSVLIPCLQDFLKDGILRLHSLRPLSPTRWIAGASTEFSGTPTQVLPDAPETHLPDLLPDRARWHIRVHRPV